MRQVLEVLELQHHDRPPPTDPVVAREWQALVSIGVVACKKSTGPSWVSAYAGKQSRTKRLV